MLFQPQLDPESSTPIYRQLFEHFRECIRSGRCQPGDKLPATRELAGHIGLNRTTITAAYELLEAEGLIRSHVGRGSFVAGETGAAAGGIHWRERFVSSEPEAAFALSQPPSEAPISFATSRPSADLFPVEEIRKTTAEVMASEAADVLQLGSPTGYPPLRRLLLDRALEAGEAGETDDIIITSGCQQALDLLQRILIGTGDKVAVEDPVYPGIHQVISRAGARLSGIPVGPGGMDVDRLEEALREERPKLLIVTPNFQNPTGATLPLEARRRLLRAAAEAGTIVAENDIYADLRYRGAEIPSLKRLDETGGVIQFRSFSKISFPGLRVGWVIGPRAVISRLAEAKQWSDLHTGQMAQAVLCRFASSGRLEAHRKRVVAGGRKRLTAALEACEEHLPRGSRYTRPEGGMSLWVELPEPLDAGEMLPRAVTAGASYLPGRYFAVSRSHSGSLRLSFAGLAPATIEEGLSILGGLFQEELNRVRDASRYDPAPAMV